MIEAHLMKLRKRDDISPDEEQAIRGAVSEVREVRADQNIINAGVELSTSTLLLEGMMCRYKDLQDGQRQITELHVAGDFVDLHSFTLKRLDHNVMALTPCRIAVVPHERLQYITERFPHLTRVYWFSSNLDAAIHREWELSLGRRDAMSKVAHLFCELFVRLEIVGLTEGNSYAFPLTQTDIAECKALTPVHVNRTLQELRKRELIELAQRRMTILDRPGLEALAEFSPNYLYLEKKAR
ncbi:MAG: Crp/Fnr family transcriptional regulator [Pseudomonadota bacterium]|nr:Crp/Fnr family transcriptional regulator [Pseudomonadota bacterium]